MKQVKQNTNVYMILSGYKLPPFVIKTTFLWSQRVVLLAELHCSCI